MKKKNKIFWFEGLSGSGKTTLANKIKNDIEEFLGPTIVINGDNIRSIFELKDYSINARKKIAKNYLKLAIFVSKQKINVIFTVVGLHGYLDKLIHSNPNIIRVLIKSNVNDIIKFGKKNTYRKNKKNIVGVDIKPIWPLKPNIIINNNFKKNTDKLAEILKKKIFKILKC
jgi:adenylylsulfate kinase